MDDITKTSCHLSIFISFVRYRDLCTLFIQTVTQSYSTHLCFHFVIKRYNLVVISSFAMKKKMLKIAYFRKSVSNNNDYSVYRIQY